MLKWIQWLVKYGNCYSLAAAAMILNSGALDPSLFNNCYDRPNQNIFLLRNGLLSLACPATSHQETDWHLVLTIMPTDLYQLLLVLMSILLSIATELRSLLLKRATSSLPINMPLGLVTSTHHLGYPMV